MNRIGVLAVIGLGCLWGCARVEPVPADGGDTAKPKAVKSTTTKPADQPSGVYAFTVKDIDGKDRSLSEYRGKVLLVVNVASKCGFTPQYAGLEKLYTEYQPKGLVIIGVPSNDFHQQEPGTADQIKQFCSGTYGVTFPLMAKVSVKNGPEQAPLYQYLTQKSRNGVTDAVVSWNFNKFLVGKDGRLIKHYESKVTPEDAGLRADIEAALRS